jgi:hypothetical protein
LWLSLRKVARRILPQGETFKLYEELKPQVNPGCDRYTEMRIKNSRLVPGMLVVDLEDKLASTSVCELKIAPNRRQFKVKQSAKDSCGSLPSRGNGQAIEGEQLVGASIPVEIFDHRSRLCEDLRAPVEVRVGTGSNQYMLFASKIVASGNAAAGANCDVSTVRCEILPACQEGKVPTALNGCYGACVAPSQCAPRTFKCSDGPAFCEIVPPRCAAGEVLTTKNGCFGPCVPKSVCK